MHDIWTAECLFCLEEHETVLGSFSEFVTMQTAARAAMKHGESSIILNSLASLLPCISENDL